jgi:Tfp pilus assembly protein FimT
MLALPLVVVACSGAHVSKMLDSKQAASQIAGYLASTYGLANPVVNCPGGVKVKVKGTFDCRTSLEGQPLTVHATLTDDQGHFTPKPAAAVVVVAKVATAIESTEAKATLRCGSHTVLVGQVGATFVCTATTASGPATYRVTVADLAGNVRYEPVGAEAG